MSTSEARKPSDNTLRGDKAKGPKGKGGKATPAPAGRIAESVVNVHRAPGVNITKHSKVSYPTAQVVSVVYQVTFDGHAPLPFQRLCDAKERATQPAPEASVPVVTSTETATVEVTTAE
jgi:hypothetical protein